MRVHIDLSARFEKPYNAFQRHWLLVFRTTLTSFKAKIWHFAKLTIFRRTGRSRKWLLVCFECSEEALQCHTSHGSGCKMLSTNVTSLFTYQLNYLLFGTRIHFHAKLWRMSVWNVNFAAGGWNFGLHIQMLFNINSKLLAWHCITMVMASCIWTYCDIYWNITEFHWVCSVGLIYLNNC